MANFEYEYVLIRYGELTTKGKNKKDFIRQLLQNIKEVLVGFEKLTYQSSRDHIYIMLNGTNPDDLAPYLKKVFGIRSFSPCLKTNNDIDAIVQATEIIMADKKGTFKVVTKRANKNFPIHSDEVNRKVASNILKKNENLKVNVHQPDYPLIVEIRDEYTYIMAQTVLASGGYPVGVGHKGLLMLSGGIDSPVAGYLAMKRGVQIQAIHYASSPYTSEAALNKVKELAKQISVYQGKIKLHIVNFTDLQLAIYKNCDESYAITIMRRMMYRIAQAIAEKNKCLAIINGESIGQVASQTLDSMATINSVTNMPVIRPLVTYDKLEIIDLAKQIGTYDTSILPFEDCCTIFTPKNPVTKPRIDKCEMFEKHFNWQELLQQCIDSVETICIDPNTSFDEIDIL